MDIIHVAFKTYKKLKDGATLPSLHFSPGGVERVENAFQSYFVIKENVIIFFRYLSL